MSLPGVLERIEQACHRVGRHPSQVRLVRKRPAAAAADDRGDSVPSSEAGKVGARRLAEAF